MSIMQMLASYGESSGGGGAVLPGTLSIWARYKASSMPTADGVKLSQWDDISGNARHATQATSGNQPKMKFGAPGLVGNTKALEFSGSSDATKTFFNVPDMSGISQGEIFMFMRISVQYNRIYQMGNPGPLGDDGYYPWSNGSIYNKFGRSGRIDNILNGQVASVAGTWHTHNAYSGTNLWGMRINTLTEYVSFFANTPVFPSSPRLGADGDGSSYPYSLAGNSGTAGYLAEVIICNAIATSGERSAVRAYFGAEYLGL